MLTGTSIGIFTDEEKIKWGNDFREEINTALQETTFFVPVLTPTYFLREECRNEMSQFVRSADALGMSQLLLSIRYVPIPDLTEDSTDHLKSIAAKMQFEPWEKLRLEDENSSVHRKAVNKLAQRLVELTEQLETTSRIPKPSGALGANTETSQLQSTLDNSHANKNTTDVEAQRASSLGKSIKTIEMNNKSLLDDEGLGLIDRAADWEPAMESWLSDLNQLTEVSNQFNAKFQAATDRINKQNNENISFAGKIVILRDLAKDLEPDIEKIESLSKAYSSGLLRIDASIRAVFSISEISTEDNNSAQLIGLRSSISNLTELTEQAMDGLQTAVDAARQNAGLSRDLRPILRRYETSMRNIIDASTVIKEWGAL
jgi:hypothetical protein